MIGKGDVVTRDKLNRLAAEAGERIRVAGGGKTYPHSNPNINQILYAGGSGVGGGIVVRYVLKLPPINKKKNTPVFVYWCSEETGQVVLGESGGTGDDQVWVWYPHSSYYVPVQRYTTLSGFPEFS